jgi:hypothetical protein
MRALLTLLCVGLGFSVGALIARCRQRIGRPSAPEPVDWRHIFRNGDHEDQL